MKTVEYDERGYAKVNLQNVSSEAELGIIRKRLSAIVKKANELFSSRSSDAVTLEKARECSREYKSAADHIVYAQGFTPEMPLNTSKGINEISALIAIAYADCEQSDDWPEADQPKEKIQNG